MYSAARLFVASTGNRPRSAADIKADHYLKESLRCLPLMWESVEIAGLPLSGIVPNQKTRATATRVSDPFKLQHPLCGRMAFAGLTRPFSRTKYPMSSWKVARGAFGNVTGWEGPSVDCLTVS